MQELGEFFHYFFVYFAFNSFLGGVDNNSSPSSSTLNLGALGFNDYAVFGFIDAYAVLHSGYD